MPSLGRNKESPTPPPGDNQSVDRQAQQSGEKVSPLITSGVAWMVMRLKVSSSGTSRQGLKRTARVQAFLQGKGRGGTSKTAHKNALKSVRGWICVFAGCAILFRQWRKPRGLIYHLLILKGKLRTMKTINDTQNSTSADMASTQGQALCCYLKAVALSQRKSNASNQWEILAFPRHVEASNVTLPRIKTRKMWSI